MTLFFNETATTEIYTYGHTLSLRDALPICRVSPDFRPSCRNSPGWSLAREEDDVMPQFEDAQAQRAEARRSEEHMSELQSLMRTSYAVFCLKKKIKLLISLPS